MILHLRSPHLCRNACRDVAPHQIAATQAGAGSAAGCWRAVCFAWHAGRLPAPAPGDVPFSGSQCSSIPVRDSAQTQAAAYRSGCLNGLCMPDLGVAFIDATKGSTSYSCVSGTCSRKQAQCRP